MLVRRPEWRIVGWMLVFGLVAIAGYAEGGTAQQEGTQLLVACGLQEVSFERQNNELSITYAFSEQFSDKLALALIAVGTQGVVGGCDKVYVIARREGRRFLEFSTSPSGLMHFAERNAGTEVMAEASRLLQKAAASAGISQIGQSDESRYQTPQAGSAPLPTANEPPSLQPGFASQLAQALVGAGLENAAVSVLDSGQIAVEYENRTYRSGTEALSTAAHIASQYCPAGTALHLTAKRDDVPVITVITKAGDSQQLPEPGAVPEGLKETRPTAPDSEVADSSGLLNESFGRFDLSFRPALSYQIGNWRRPIITDWFVLPQLTTTLGPGWRASLRGR
ncbi:MAG: YjbH domain-containing protein, partial [Armatimonadetes bacterium]|nr:YjbH domain-containing protein [Armatimonadota bacterium]